MIQDLDWSGNGMALEEIVKLFHSVDKFNWLKITEEYENIISKTICKSAVKKANKLMRNKGRILVRKSGTEPKIRIMAESNDKKIIYKEYFLCNSC